MRKEDFPRKNPLHLPVDARSAVPADRTLLRDVEPTATLRGLARSAVRQITERAMRLKTGSDLATASGA